MTVTQPEPDVLDAALAYHDAGISVIPIRTDGSKAPLIAWKPYMQQLATREQVQQWFSNGHPGLGIITGAISGNLELLELEGRARDAGALHQLGETALASGLAELWRRVTTGWMNLSPSGGVHFLVRSLAPVAGNTKLARRPSTDQELAANPKDKIKVLAETRGEGGFVVAPPSHGTVHPTGRPWQRALGGPTTIPDVTPDELDALHILFRTLDQMPEPPAPITAAAAQQPLTPADAYLLGQAPAAAAGVAPGDDYATRTNWDQILRPAGWTPIRATSRETYWRRPGKDTPGISATTGYGDGDWLYVFSSSTDLPDNQTLTKFAAYTHLEHRGDYSAAARELRRLGYGTPAPEQPRPAAALAATDGDVNTATAAAVKDAQDQGAAGPHLSPGSAPASPSAPHQPGTYSRTDDGNALRLVDAHRDILRYCPDRGQWLAWDGHRWRWDHAGRVRELARGISRALPNDSREDQGHRKWSLSARGLAAMVRVAETDPKVNVSITRLDARPHELNTPAGVIDLRTGTLRQPDPDALHTRATATAPDLTGQPERWLRFLADTFAGDPELTAYMQRLLGQALIGRVAEQVLPFLYGEGANGKTTLLSTVQRIVGLGDDGYAQAASSDLLIATYGSSHPTELARLAGARLVVTSELEDGQQFAEAKVKLLTGRDVISARFMRQDAFDFTPTHSLFLLANHAPQVRTGGPAFWRRLRQIPFLHVVPPEQRNDQLEDQLVDEEGPQILGWLIRGTVDYLTHGIGTPASVLTATAAYEKDQDTVGRFVDDACQTGPVGQQGMRVKVAELRQSYETWCRVEGETPVSAKALTLTLRSRYAVQADRDKSARWYDGIRLSDIDTSPEPSPDGIDPDPQDTWHR